MVDDDSDEFYYSLLYALQRGIQFYYQIEEQEVSAELIGTGANRRLMMWEAVEGGTGVWERMIEDNDAFAELAKEALRISHFDPATGQEEDGHDTGRCAVACYECLLSYSNQMQHRFLDRNLAKDFLFRMSRSHVEVVVQGRERGDQFEWLMGLSGSTLEKDFLRALRSGGFNLPDDSQNRPTDQVGVQPDFYYERRNIAGVCIFVDGPSHDSPEAMQHDARVRGQLEDLGFRVIAVRYDRNIVDQIEGNLDVFGQGNSKN
jgi:hypothetical protein